MRRESAGNACGEGGNYPSSRALRAPGNALRGAHGDCSRLPALLHPPGAWCLGFVVVRACRRSYPSHPGRGAMGLWLFAPAGAPTSHPGRGALGLWLFAPAGAPTFHPERGAFDPAVVRAFGRFCMPSGRAVVHIGAPAGAKRAFPPHRRSPWPLPVPRFPSSPPNPSPTAPPPRAAPARSPPPAPATAPAASGRGRPAGRASGAGRRRGRTPSRGSRSTHCPG